MVYIPDEEEWLAAMEKARQDAEHVEPDEMETFVPPVHPVPQLQGPFEESIEESNLNRIASTTVYIDAQTRRNDLLTRERYERLCGRKWLQRPGEKYHPLWKLIAQISFGVHLLARGLAKSELDVMHILQTHVNEMDGFIERTAEDFVLAREDIEERRKFLKLPLENLDLFVEMLEDRQFRHAVVKDNEKIDFIVHRTAACMKDAFKDAKKGVESVQALGQYLDNLGNDWPDRPQHLDAVYEAMRGNVDGWNREFKQLQKKGYKLALSLAELSGIAVEMQRHVGAVSRKSVIFQAPPTQSSHSNYARKTARKASKQPRQRVNLDKPLPTFPPAQDPTLSGFINEALLDPRDLQPSSSLSYGVPSPHSPRSTLNRSVSFKEPLEQRRHSVASVDLRTPRRGFSLKGRRVSDPGDSPVLTRPSSAPTLSLFPPPQTAEQLEKKRAQEKSALRAAFESLALFDKPKSSTPRATLSKREPRRKRSRSKLGLSISSPRDQGRSTRNGLIPFGFLRSRSVNDLLDGSPPTSRGAQTVIPPDTSRPQDREMITSRREGNPQIPHLFMLAEIPERPSLENAKETAPSVQTGDETIGENRPITALPSFESWSLYLSDESASGSEKALKPVSTANHDSQIDTDIRLASSNFGELKTQFPKMETLVAGYHKSPAPQELRIKIDGNRKDENPERPLSKKPSFFARKRPGTRDSLSHGHATLLSRPSTARSSIFSKPEPTSPATFTFHTISSIGEESKQGTEETEPHDIESTKARLGLGVQLGMHANLAECYTPLAPPSDFGGKHTFFPGGKRPAGKENGGSNKKGKDTNHARSPSAGGKRTLLKIFSPSSINSNSTKSITSSMASPHPDKGNGLLSPYSHVDESR